MPLNTIETSSMDAYLQQQKDFELNQQQELQREYERILKQQQMATKWPKLHSCKVCNRLINDVRFNICNVCYLNQRRWGTELGRTITVNHLLKLGEVIKHQYKPSKELIKLVEEYQELHKETVKTHCNRIDGHFIPTSSTSIAIALLNTLHFSMDREIIPSGFAMGTYLLYILHSIAYLRDSVKKRKKAWTQLSNSQLFVTLVIEFYTDYREYINGRNIHQHYQQLKPSDFEDLDNYRTKAIFQDDLGSARNS